MWGFFGGAERHWLGDDPDWFNSFPTKTIEGLRRFLKLFSVETHLFECCEEKDFGLTSIINEDFGDITYIDVDCDDHGIGMGKRS
jgi:hypothetical protein